MNRRELITGAAASALFAGLQDAEAMSPGHRIVLGGAGKLIAPYVGLVATRCRSQTTFGSTFRQANFRSMHIARDAISSLKIGFGNFYATLAQEAGTGASLTLTASVEYPSGTFTQVTFSGSSSVVIANKAVSESDFINVSIPDGATFFVRTYHQCSAGIIYETYGSATLGDGNEFTTTTTTDKTMGGTIPGGANCHRPLYIVGTTRRRSVALLGDSMNAGNNELQTSAEVNPDTGILARWIGPICAYSQLGCGSEKASDFPTQGALRRTVIPYVSDGITQWGINDINATSPTLGAIESAMQTNWAYFTSQGKRVYQTTITPNPSATSDSWATPAEQTVSAKNALRVSLDTDIRNGAISGVNGFFELAWLLENSPDDGKYITNGTANFYTSDGLHGVGATAYLLLQNNAALVAQAQARFGH